VILRLLHPGSAGGTAFDELARRYQKRLGRHIRCEEQFVKASKERDRPRALAEEAERLARYVKPRDRTVALTPFDKPWSSEHLAARLQAWMNSGATAVNFLLGSAEGLSGEAIERADERWSFGPLTLPHDLARVVLWEQLYRASTILRGEPYHK
jgi:23S rRNA (pseudouridine1915-N3)-methyltransferase